MDARVAVESQRAAGGPSPAWIGALVAGVAAISLGHYLTDPSMVHWHVVFQRLYYIPILIGAVLFGFRGGILIALLTSVLYLPHVMLHWGHDTAYRWAQFTEIGLFPAFGAFAGVMLDRIRSERERHRKTAEELARAYEQLQATFERLRLEDRMAALGALSVGMAHEIRNPLGSISGGIEILEQAIPADDARREFVGILKREIARLDDLVERQLDLARTGSGEREACDLAEIASSVTDLARKRAEGQGVTVVVDLDRESPAAWADGSRIRQAVLNLVVNAIQAMPSGGELRVAVRGSGDRVILEVADRGAGISDEARGRLFEPFFTTKREGTGLGLAIAWQIAQQHGGDLCADNRAGGGARFVLALPTAEAGRERAERAS
jgi:signal transduction histidine kinase